jgi:hypothetical protein
MNVNETIILTKIATTNNLILTNLGIPIYGKNYYLSATITYSAFLASNNAFVNLYLRNDTSTLVINNKCIPNNFFKTCSNGYYYSCGINIDVTSMIMAKYGGSLNIISIASDINAVTGATYCGNDYSYVIEYTISSYTLPTSSPTSHPTQESLSINGMLFIYFIINLNY